MTQFFARKLNKKGFTLAELLIVVAIIAILIAVAIPIYTGAMQEAQKKVNMSNERALRGAAASEIMMHWNEASNDNIPAGAGPGAVSPGKYKFSEGADADVGWYAWAWFDGNGNMGTVHVGVGTTFDSNLGVVSSATAPEDNDAVLDLTPESDKDNWGKTTNPNVIIIKLTATEINHS